MISGKLKYSDPPSSLAQMIVSKHEGQAMKADINYVNESIDSIFEMPHLFF